MQTRRAGGRPMIHDLISKRTDEPPSAAGPLQRQAHASAGNRNGNGSATGDSPALLGPNARIMPSNYPLSLVIPSAGGDPPSGNTPAGDGQPAWPNDGQESLIAEDPNAAVANIWPAGILRRRRTTNAGSAPHSSLTHSSSAPVLLRLPSFPVARSYSRSPSRSSASSTSSSDGLVGNTPMAVSMSATPATLMLSDALQILERFATDSRTVLATELGATLSGFLSTITGGALPASLLARAVGPLLMANAVQSFFGNWTSDGPDTRPSRLGVTASGFTGFAGWTAFSTAYWGDQAANYLNRWGGAFSLIPELADLREAWNIRNTGRTRSVVLVARAVAIVVAFVFIWLATADTQETSDEDTQRINGILASLFPFIATMFGISAEALRHDLGLARLLQEQVRRLRPQRNAQHTALGTDPDIERGPM